MKKIIGVLVALLLATLGVVTLTAPASAKDDTCVPADAVYKTEVSDWVTEKPEGDGWEQVDEREFAAPPAVQEKHLYKKWVEATYKEVENPDYVPERTVEHEAEYVTEHEYIKQVKGKIQVDLDPRGGKYEWVNTGKKFDWENWSGNTLRWEGEGFTESGPHNAVQAQWTEGKWVKVEYRKITTHYRYVPTGETREKKVKDAWTETIPAEGEPTVEVVDVEAHYDYEWFDSKEEREGWEHVKSKTETIGEGSTIREYKYQRDVLVSEAVDCPTPEPEETIPPAPEPEDEKIVPVLNKPTPPAPVDTPQVDRLAETGFPAPIGFAAAALLAGAGAGMKRWSMNR